ncbi:hypothetical protein ACU6U9_07680 [Pseudomonas sp. HK3]
MSKLSSLNVYFDTNQSNKNTGQQGIDKLSMPLGNKQLLKPLELLVFELQQAKFEKAVSQDNVIDQAFDKNLFNTMSIGRHVPLFQSLENPFRIEKNRAINHPEKTNGLSLNDSIRALISNLSMKEDALDEVNVMDGSRVQLVNNHTDFTKSNVRINESNQSGLVSKINLVQSMEAEILPKLSGILDKKTVTIRLSGEGTAGLEIQVSRQGGELSMLVKTTNADVFNQVINARQDIQYSLESKLPNMMVRIDMDLTDQSDRESKGHYVLPDEDES